MATLAFNDQPLNNDLSGTLQGSVLFAQTSIIPSRASMLEGDVHPRLVAQRTALVLFKPISTISLPCITLQVTDRENEVLYSACMSAPDQLPGIAGAGIEIEGARLVYGENFWTCVLPWQHIVAGMGLRLGSGALSGTLADIPVGSAGELVLHTIDLGFMVAPQDIFTSRFTPELRRQYFQQTPCSRLLVNPYEPAHWTEIMLPDGTLYTEQALSPSTFDVYNSDMHDRIAWELVSLGINNANQGVCSSPGKGINGLANVGRASQITAHSLIARYQGGQKIHGLLAGGGVTTVTDCKGNEFSHEMSHNYGLHHYPGGFVGSIHAPADALNSTWGWDSDHNLFIPNFQEKATGEETCQDGECRPPFHGHRFGRDTQAGGKPLYPAFNAYTLMTPHSLNRAQSNLDGRHVFDPAASSGYSKWNKTTGGMDELAEFRYVEPEEVDEASMTALLAKHRLLEVSMYNAHYNRHTWIPAASGKNKGKGVHVLHHATYEGNLHVNGEVIKMVDGDVLNFESNGSTWVKVADFSFNVPRKPKQHGVPITTVLGYYDPEGSLPDYLYPALHGAWGNAFESDRDVEAKACKCYVELRNAKGQSLKYVLRSTRGEQGLMNRVHVQVAQSFAATSAILYRDGVAVLTKALQKPAGGVRATVHGRA